MLSTVNLTKLNTIKHLNCNLTNASFSDPKIKASNSLIMTSDKSCISASLKHTLGGIDKKINKNAMTEGITLSKKMSSCMALTGNGKKTNPCSAGKGCIKASLSTVKPKLNCNLLKKNSSVSINDIHSAENLRAL